MVIGALRAPARVFPRERQEEQVEQVEVEQVEQVEQGEQQVPQEERRSIALLSLAEESEKQQGSEESSSTSSSSSSFPPSFSSSPPLFKDLRVSLWVRVLVPIIIVLDVILLITAHAASGARVILWLNVNHLFSPSSLSLYLSISLSHTHTHTPLLTTKGHGLIVIGRKNHQSNIENSLM